MAEIPPVYLTLALVEAGPIEWRELELVSQRLKLLSIALKLVVRDQLSHPESVLHKHTKLIDVELPVLGLVQDVE